LDDRIELVGNQRNLRRQSKSIRVIAVPSRRRKERRKRREPSSKGKKDPVSIEKVSCYDMKRLEG